MSVLNLKRLEVNLAQDVYDFLADEDFISDIPGPFYYLPNSKLWDCFDEYLKSIEVLNDKQK